MISLLMFLCILRTFYVINIHKKVNRKLLKLEDKNKFFVYSNMFTQLDKHIFSLYNWSVDDFFPNIHDYIDVNDIFTLD